MSFESKASRNVQVNDIEENSIDFYRINKNYIKIEIGCFNLAISIPEAKKCVEALKHVINVSFMPKDYWKNLLVKKTTN